MRVEVKLFAVAKQIAGAESLALELREDATIADLRAALVDQFPELGTTLHHVSFAVDAEYAADDVVLRAESEVACIPPVSGG